MDRDSVWLMALILEIYDNDGNWFKLPAPDGEYWEGDMYNDRFFVDAVQVVTIS